ncbi:MAG: tRNA pseudouridine(55) synthase TruB [Candidatus Omnitrophota bacterium]
MNVELAGIIVVDKEKGMTSHDVVAKIRKKFGIKKVGHAGTLDPNATGVLVVLLGKATKLSNQFLNEDKEYTAQIKLGEKTDSADCDGKIINVRDVNVTPEDIKAAVFRFTGEIEQVPPMVSAKKINGKKLYKLARKGIEVDRPARKIFINRIEITNIDIPLVSFRMECSKGTYVRQIADDIGEELGCGAHLTELRRTRSGSFSLKNSVKVANLLTMDKETFYESVIRI